MARSLHVLHTCCTLTIQYAFIDCKTIGARADARAHDANPAGKSLGLLTAVSERI